MNDARLYELADRLGRQLLARQWSVAVAESCTGGALAMQITRVAGSSQWFDRGFVTYTNAAKQQMLGVAAASLLRHGAVSEPVVAEMVAGALARSDAELAVAISGIAGPGGGSKEKPVGMVCFAWQSKGGTVTTQTINFTGNRDEVRAKAVEHALAGLLGRATV